MQTFLPYPNFALSAHHLDWRRLGKQRSEARQILSALMGASSGWISHPAVKMWVGCEMALALYGDVVIREWERRGYKNTMHLLNPDPSDVVMPSWLGDEEFHASHRSRLLMKDPYWYSQFGWSEEVWSTSGQYTRRRELPVPIYIPSRGRHTPYQVWSGPLVDIPADVEWTYVVPLSEAQAYTDALTEVCTPGTKITVLGVPDNISGIAKTRHWIGRHAESVGQSKFLMLDDDVRFLVRRSSDTWQLRGTTPDEVRDLLFFISQKLDTHGHVGVSAREGNNRLGVGGPDDVGNENTRTLRALAYRTADFLSVEHGRVDVMEDFDVNLQLLEMGVPNYNIGYWAQGQKMTNAPGGCSIYRSQEVQDSSARRLQELHGTDIIRLRTKQNKTDADGFGSRTEVTIQWRRAYRPADAQQESAQEQETN